jgi:hypothetical protein
VHVAGLKLPVADPVTPKVTTLPLALLVAVTVTGSIDPAGAVTADTCTGPVDKIGPTVQPVTPTTRSETQNAETQPNL